MKKALFAIFALFPPLLFAAPNADQSSTPVADVELTAATDHLDVGAGEAFTVRFTVSNDGPDAAPSVRLNISVSNASWPRPRYPLILRIDQKGWSCGAYCIRDSLASGTSSTVSVTFAAPITPGSFTVTGDIGPYLSFTDPDGVKPVRLDPNVMYSDKATDVAVGDLAGTPYVDGPYSRNRTSAKISNNGSVAAKSLRAVFSLGSAVLISANAPGWNCEPLAYGAICTAAQLAAGSSSMIEMVTSQQRRESNVIVSFTGAVDTDPSNNARFVAPQAVSPPLLLRDDYAALLVPLALPTLEGAFGSRWETHVTLVNGNDTPLIARSDLLYHFETGCMFPECPSPPNVLAQTAITPDILRLWQPTNPGVILYVRKTVAANTSVNLRIQDSSRRLDTWGTEIPVVSEGDFRSGRIILPDVPLDTHFRQTIRLYGVDGRSGDSVVLRIYGEGPAPLAETVIELRADPGNQLPAGFAEFPSYAQLGDLIALFPEISGYDRVRIEVEPLTPGLRYWAFASITNNETQHVTTITPQ